MKKVLYFAMAAAMGSMLASCEPALIDGPEPSAAVSETTLASGLTYTQYADEACTQEDPAGNYLKYNSTAGIVQVFLASAPESVLQTGAGGVVKIPVKRGQDPQATLLFKLVNFDGSTTSCQQTVSVTPPTALSAEMLILCSDNGQKVWKFSQTPSMAYGNGGHTGSGAGFDNGAVDGCWWGVENADALIDQIQHAGGTAYGDEDVNAYMVFTEDGVVTSYKSNGEKIRGGKFEVKNYDPARSSGWEIGKLVTSEAALLFPWSINEGGKAVTEFDIMYMTPQLMTLVYTKGNAAGGWGEITHWQFMGATPEPLTLEGKWGWSSTAANVWGNGGHTGSGASFNAPGVIDGNWWGVGTAEELLDQMGHSGDGNTGDASSDAYMVFEGNTVATYAADGSKIRGGEYQTVMNDFVSGAGRGASGWELGKLTTDAPALLFPWSINEGGKEVTEFDIMYFDANNMTLVYTKGNAAGGWGEITHWVFERK